MPDWIVQIYKWLVSIGADDRRTLVLALGAFVGVLFAVWRSRSASRQADAATRQAANAEQGQVTERFTRAIEQLGSTDNGTHNVPVRLGAIYALERIAIDSRDYIGTVAEVLGAYAMMNASQPLLSDKAEDSAHQHDKQPSGSVTEQSTSTVPLERDALRADILAVIAVAKRWRHEGNPLELDAVNFSQRFMPNLIMDGLELSGADFRHAVLIRASLRGANLHGANFIGAQLSHAVLNDANLIFAGFEGTDLQHSRLKNAHLMSATLFATKLDYADLRCADLSSAQLGDADFYRANLANADLTQADLADTKFCSADLTDTNFQFVRNSHLADFSDAYTKDANGIKSAFVWNPDEWDVLSPPDPTSN